MHLNIFSFLFGKDEYNKFVNDRGWGQTLN